VRASSFPCLLPVCVPVERGEGARGPIRPTRAGIRYRLGDQKFYGNGSEFKVDTTKPFTVVTQFVTHDGTDTGDVVEIRRKYVQGGVVIDNTNITLNGKTYNSISDDFCEDEATAFKYTNEDAYETHGGLKETSDVLGRGMVRRPPRPACLPACILALPSPPPPPPPQALFTHRISFSPSGEFPAPAAGRGEILCAPPTLADRQPAVPCCAVLCRRRCAMCPPPAASRLPPPKGAGHVAVGRPRRQHAVA
jgi:hypothetical protein